MSEKKTQAVIHDIDGEKHISIPVARVGHINAKFAMFAEGTVMIVFRIDPVDWMDIMESDDLRRQIQTVQRNKAGRDQDHE